MALARVDHSLVAAPVAQALGDVGGALAGENDFMQRYLDGDVVKTGG